MTDQERENLRDLSERFREAAVALKAAEVAALEARLAFVAAWYELLSDEDKAIVDRYDE